MLNKLTLWSVSFLFFILTSNPIYSAEIHSQQGGDWESSDTWEGGQVPTSDDDVYIHNGHKILIHEATTIISLIVEGVLIFDVKVEALKVLKSVHIKDKGEFLVEKFNEQMLIVSGDITNENNIEIPIIQFEAIENVTFISKKELKIQLIRLKNKKPNIETVFILNNIILEKSDNGWLDIEEGHAVIESIYSKQEKTIFVEENLKKTATITENAILTINSPDYVFNVLESSFLVKGAFNLLQGKCNIGSAIDHDFQYENGALLNIEGGEMNVAGSIVSKGFASKINFGAASIWLNTLSPASIDKSLLDIAASTVTLNGTNFHFANPVVSKKRTIQIETAKLDNHDISYFFHNPTKVNFPYYISGKLDNINILDDKNTVILNDNSEVKKLDISKGTLDLNGKNLRIQNEIQNNGTIKASGGDLYFVGENAQKTSGKGIFATKNEPFNNVFLTIKKR